MRAVDSARAKGRLAERAAERLLRRKGLVILARNWRGAGGEIDLAALQGRTLVFCEVKYRSHGFHPDHAAVASGQRARTARAARAFRNRYGVAHLAYRFDLVTVTGDPAHPEHIDWQENYSRTGMERS